MIQGLSSESHDPRLIKEKNGLGNISAEIQCKILLILYTNRDIPSSQCNLIKKLKPKNVFPFSFLCYGRLFSSS